MKKIRFQGFSLMEIVVVIAIVAVIMVVAVPVYNTTVKKAMSEEGKELVKSIASAEKLYKANYGSYLAVGATNNEPLLQVDLRNNTYFTLFSVTAPGGGLSVIVTGSGEATGLSVVYTMPPNNTPTITINGL